MAEVLVKIVMNCATGEESVVPLMAEEIAQRKADIEASKALSGTLD